MGERCTWPQCICVNTANCKRRMIALRFNWPAAWKAKAKELRGKVRHEGHERVRLLKVIGAQTARHDELRRLVQEFLTGFDNAMACPPDNPCATECWDAMQTNVTALRAALEGRG